MKAARPFWGAVLIVLAVFAVYFPAFTGEFLWDDFLVIHRNPLVTGTLGVGSIWFRTDFPLATLVFWLEWLAWGQHTLGYHLVNAILHAASALLLWRVLSRLRIPGCWLAGMLFAVHPVCVGSVAWIAELKNTLSLPFFLLSLSCYLKSEPDSRITDHVSRTSLLYILSLLAFLLALLAKTSTVMLPVVLLGCAWWRRGRISLRDLLRALPFFLLALAFGLLTIRFQAQGAISGVDVQSDSFWGRLAGAGWALWFYLGKALLPLNLNVIYPLWKIDAAAPLSYLPLALWCAALAVGWVFRRTWGRHVLFSLGCFTVLLLPVLGFLDMYYLKLSRVSDHFAYLPLIAVVALLAGGLRIWCGKPWPGGANTEDANHTDNPPEGDAATPTGALRGFRKFTWLVPWLLIVSFAVLANLHARIFVTEEALWQATVTRNPNAWLAHANLGWILASQQKFGDAQAHLEKSLELNAENAQAHSNLGRLLSMQGRREEAEAQFQTAVRLKPTDAEIRRSYAMVLAEQGRRDDAMRQLRELLRVRADVEASLQLASLLYQTGKARDAVAEYRTVLAANPDHAQASNNLAWMLATSSDATIRDGPEAVRLAELACRLKAYKEGPMLGTLAAAYAEAGRFSDAVATAQKVIDLATENRNPQLAGMGGQLLTLFRAGKPYHEPAVASPVPNRQ